MNEETLRLVIRDAIARHLSAPSPTATEARRVTVAPTHVSHLRLPLAVDDGPCVVEPTVACTHCGFCQSFGH